MCKMSIYCGKGIIELIRVTRMLHQELLRLAANRSVNSLPNDTILDRSKLKVHVFSNDKLNMTEI